LEAFPAESGGFLRSAFRRNPPRLPSHTPVGRHRVSLTSTDEGVGRGGRPRGGAEIKVVKFVVSEDSGILDDPGHIPPGLHTTSRHVLPYYNRAAIDVVCAQATAMRIDIAHHQRSCT
jgi:hypothetical protein